MDKSILMLVKQVIMRAQRTSTIHSHFLRAHFFGAQPFVLARLISFGHCRTLATSPRR
jgi:hypothetical protein